MNTSELLLVGEIFVDFTVASQTTPCKMRLGGIVHSARGLWACGIPYSVAAVCPAYIAAEAEEYLRMHGCIQFITIGNVIGSPNVIVIGDATEVTDQGYEEILRDRKYVEPKDNLELLRKFPRVTIFPGRYDVAQIINSLDENSRIVIDVAYNFNRQDIDRLPVGRIYSMAISTSSELFMDIAHDKIDEFLSITKKARICYVLLKENRGGSRLFDVTKNIVYSIPSILQVTANSVGVGDVYTAVFSAFIDIKPESAAWRGMQAATCYAQTTFPDDFKTNLTRDLALPIDVVKGLGGVFLPWHERKKYMVYLASPDFTYIHKPEIDHAVRSLEYHNFKVCRPIQENGEAPQNADQSKLFKYYDKDLSLLDECSAVFAVPLNRDPGTLVEIGWAIAKGKPVITFDPRKENSNTMVICGSNVYSDDLDICLNGLFVSLSRLRVA